MGAGRFFSPAEQNYVYPTFFWFSSHARLPWPARDAGLVVLDAALFLQVILFMAAVPFPFHFFSNSEDSRFCLFPGLISRRTSAVQERWCLGFYFAFFLDFSARLLPPTIFLYFFRPKQKQIIGGPSLTP